METIEGCEIDRVLSLSSIQLLNERKLHEDSGRKRRPINQEQVQGSTTDDAFAGVTPPTKRARTTYDVFLEQELRALIGEIPLDQIPDHVSQAISERWRTMSSEESQLYVELLEVETLESVQEDHGDLAGPRVEASTVGLNEPKSVLEQRGLTPSFRSALATFLLHPHETDRSHH